MYMNVIDLFNHPSTLIDIEVNNLIINNQPFLNVQTGDEPNINKQTQSLPQR
jgi:hypothetical protein